MAVARYAGAVLEGQDRVDFLVIVDLLGRVAVKAIRLVDEAVEASSGRNICR